MITNTNYFFSEDLRKRSYVYFYYNGKRIRIYNGKLFNFNCSPNLIPKPKARFKALITLENKVSEQLRNGWLPGIQKHLIQITFSELINEYLNSSYSKRYIKDCIIVIRELLEYCKEKNLLNRELSTILSSNIEEFLIKFNDSNAYYSIKRRTLSSVFGKLVLRGIITTNPVLKTTQKRVEAVHNQAFTQLQLREIIDYVYKKNSNLYLCILIMYCMLLRPHKEIRLLTRGNFDEQLLVLTLSGRENKSKRVRTVPVPENIRSILIENGIQFMPSHFNIFSLSEKPFNEYFFKTAWTRVKSKMLETGKINKFHTLYSFRHTAICTVFKEKKDLHLIQRLCSHQSMTTSMRYLRSLGLEQVGNLEDFPKLNY